MHRKLINTKVPGYARDPETGVIHATNFSELDRIIERRTAHIREQENKATIANLKKDVFKLNEDISDIKAMLTKLLER